MPRRTNAADNAAKSNPPVVVPTGKPVDPLAGIKFDLPGEGNNPARPGGSSATSSTAAMPPVVTTPANPLSVLFSVREISRIGTLTVEIVTLRARAQELTDRAEKSAQALFDLATNNPQAEGNPINGEAVIAELQALRGGPDTEKPFPECVNAYVSKLRAKAKLAAAQREFEALRDLAGETTLGDILVSSLREIGKPPEEKPVENNNPHNLETQPLEDSGGGSVAGPGTIKLPASDALPPVEEDDDCPS